MWKKFSDQKKFWENFKKNLMSTDFLEIFFCFVETPMNERECSHPNYENCENVILGWLPASGPLRSMAGQYVVFKLWRGTDPPRGLTRKGAPAFIILGGYGGISPHHHIQESG